MYLCAYKPARFLRLEAYMYLCLSSLQDFCVLKHICPCVYQVCKIDFCVLRKHIRTLVSMKPARLFLPTSHVATALPNFTLMSRQYTIRPKKYTIIQQKDS